MVKTGLHILLRDAEQLKNKRTALIANYSAVTSGLSYIWDALSQAGITVSLILSPEHGLFGTEQDQVPVSTEPGIKIPVKSLYGSDISSLMPQQDTFSGIDSIIFDIQDVGSRYYTYVNTMVYAMQKISGTEIEFIVLDRPNPIGGDDVEGPVLHPEYSSFVGLLPVPVRHGLTAGEMALLTKDHFDLDIDLKIISMKGWKRNMHYPDTGLAWVHPSPNMPDYETALIYPGLCLVEGMDFSEGRGTTRPFFCVGAPYMDPYRCAEHLNSFGLPGVCFRPHYFKPQFNKFAGQVLGGIYIHVTEHREVKPFLTGVALVKGMHDLYEEVTFLHGVYEFNDTYPAFDLLTGGAEIREMIQEGASLEELQQSWADDEREFRESRERWLLY